MSPRTTLALLFWDDQRSEALIPHPISSAISGEHSILKAIIASLPRWLACGVKCGLWDTPVVYLATRRWPSAGFILPPSPTLNQHWFNAPCWQGMVLTVLDHVTYFGPRHFETVVSLVVESHASTPFYKAKRQYLLTSIVSKCCFLALHGSTLGKLHQYDCINQDTFSLRSPTCWSRHTEITKEIDMSQKYQQHHFHTREAVRRVSETQFDTIKNST